MWVAVLGCLQAVIILRLDSVIPQQTKAAQLKLIWSLCKTYPLPQNIRLFPTRKMTVGGGEDALERVGLTLT